MATDIRPEPVQEQREAIDDRERDLFLSAGAGTGKTTVLVQRYCDVVCAVEGPDAGTPVDGILAFTFTDRAAAELRARIRSELQRRAWEEREGGRAARLRALARDVETGWISTIHSFCQRLLASHPLAAGLDPYFTVLDEAEASRLAARAFDSAFERFAATAGDEGFELAAAFRPSGLRDVVRIAHDELRSRGHERPELPEAGRPDVGAAVREVREAAEAALAATAGATNPQAEPHRDCMAEAAALDLGLDPSEEQVAALAFSSKATAFRCPEVERYTRAVAALGSRVVEARLAHHYECLRELLVCFAAEYAAAKDARAALDFEDLQLSARRLLASRSDLRRRYQRRFRHLMVDEFQDTNELQLSLVRLLHLEAEAEQNRLFTVGDEFQSIYSFRHADLEVFRRVGRATARRPGERATHRRLRANFRSRPEVLGLVNRLGSELLGPDYEPLRAGVPLPPAAEESPAEDSSGVEVLVTDRDGWEERISELDVSPDERAQPWRVAEARFLAARLRELADGGFPAGDMVVLLRAFTHVDAYEEALAAQGLDPYVAGGRGYWSRQQVADVRALLGAIANPLDDFALYGTLASPCCGVSPDTLWLIARAAAGRPAWSVVGQLFGAPHGDEAGAAVEPGAGAWLSEARSWVEQVPDPDAAALRELVAVLEELRRDAPRLGLETLIDRAITDTGCDLALLAKPGGRRRMANVRKLMRLARGFEADRGPDLRAFLDSIEEVSEEGDREAEAALQAEHHTGVRLMTVHAAKGLEFPLVAVADLGRGLGGGFPPALRLRPEPVDELEADEQGGSAPAIRVGLRLARLGMTSRRIFDYDRLQQLSDEETAAEERRILHVAATRAQRRLILSGACSLDRLDAEARRPLGALLPKVIAALGWDGEADSVEVAAPEGQGGVPKAVTVPVRVRRPGDGAVAVQPAAAATGAAPATGRPSASTGSSLPDPELRPPAAADGPPVTRVSYSSLSLYERCGYRFYAERVLGMRPRPPGAQVEHPATPFWPRGPEGERASVDAGGQLSLGDLPTAPPLAEVDSDVDDLSHRYARGTVVHELLEWSARNGWAAPPEGRVEELLRGEDIEPTPAESRRVSELVRGFVDSPLRRELTGAARLLAEAPFAFRLGPLIVRGEIDLLADLGTEVAVVDYKSDRLADHDPGELLERYETQRRIYALAALRRYGRPVRVVYVFLERPEEPLAARFEAGDAPALTAQLESAVRDIVGGRFRVTERPERSLCFDCPARERLCIHPPALTMRDPARAAPADTVAG